MNRLGMWSMSLGGVATTLGVVQLMAAMLSAPTPQTARARGAMTVSGVAFMLGGSALAIWGGAMCGHRRRP